MLQLQALTTFELLSLIVSITGLAVIAWQIRYSGRQTQATVFSDFSQRYAKIDDEFKDASGYYRFENLEEKNKNTYFYFLTKYLDLLHQEYELYRMGMIDAEIWKIWKKYAEAHIEGYYFDEFWNSDRGKVAFEPNMRFRNLIEEMLKRKS